MDTIFQKRFDALNDAQKEAVTTLDGPVMVVAGPGSGKTELLSLRVANILRSTDTLPGSILCLTFTDSASVNMRKRLTSLIGNDAYHVGIHTFHSFGTEILGQFREFFYGGAVMQPADEITKLQILKGIFETLPYNSPFHAKHPEQGYLYLKDASSKISDLKKGGLTAHAFRSLLEDNRTFLELAEPIIIPFFSERVSKRMLEYLPQLVADIAHLPDPTREESHFFSLKTTLLESFRAMLAGQSTQLMSAWKSKYIKSNESGDGKILKDSALLEKSFALCEVYERYGEEMLKRAYFDFDDMLLQVVEALEHKAEIRATLQEKYLYIMVDEFQDTNGVQMKLLDLLTGVLHGQEQPNILVVGDDDQAIFKFQGANLHNILGFHKKYIGAKLITLTQNYRSTQSILDLARNVIVRGEERLENHMFELEKTLIASNPQIKEGLIEEKEFPTSMGEYLWISQDIQKRIASGTPAGEIAVIARKHAHLGEIIKVCELHNIPVSYERRQNVLDEPHIQQLLCMMEYVESLVKHEALAKDYLLPHILAYPFWNIPGDVVWQISLNAAKERKTWMEIMKNQQNMTIQRICDFFIDLAVKAHTHTAEEMFDYILGVTPSMLDEEEELVEMQDENILTKESFISPYKEYYFSKERQKEHPEEYIRFLSNLQVLIQKVRSYQKNKTYISLQDILQFITLHQEYGRPIVDNNPIHNSQDAVQLLSAHKAKGMEFETVYVIHAQDDGWIDSNASSKISLPTNLPLSAEGDTNDDKLRLFFVALTRAKKNLFLTRHQYLTSGKETVRLRFLANELTDKQKKNSIPVEMLDQLRSGDMQQANASVLETLETWFHIQAPRTFSREQEIILRGALENYQMSVTHLNSFLDLIYAGPEVFLEQHILRFPQSKHPSSGYGTAMHSAVQKFYQDFKKQGILPGVNILMDYFTESLSLERMNTLDFTRFQEKGREHLKIFYEERKDSFKQTHLLEKDFRTLGVHVGEALLTGKLDRLEIDEKTREIHITDFKTGKAFSSWKASTNDKVKLWKYRRQLLFYKLLVENSSVYGYGYKAVSGSLEFLEPDTKHKVHILTLPYDECMEELEQLKQLIPVVYKKIVNLDFPDVSAYTKDMKGMEKFIADLLE